MARDQAHREAEKKIEEARRSRAITLNLSSMKLTELPESLGQLTRTSLTPRWRGAKKISDWLAGSESTALEHGEAIRAQGATLRELHTLLKPKDPSSAASSA